MKLRWRQAGETIACSASEIVYGGRNPMKPIWVLQYKDGDEWKDVPYISEEHIEKEKCGMELAQDEYIKEKLLKAVKESKLLKRNE